MRKLLYCLFIAALCGFLPQLAKAQTASFTTSPSSACASTDGCTSFTVTIGSVPYVFTLATYDAGGSMQWLENGGGNGGSMDISSGSSFDADGEKVTIKRQDGQPFSFSSIYIQNDQGNTVTVQGYKNSVGTGSPQTVAQGNKGTLNFNDLLVDEVDLTSNDFYYVSFDDFTVASAPTCTTPSASFTASQTCPSKTVQFTDASASVTSDATYLWEFGDGATSNTKGNVSHTYATANTYSVKLTITQGTCSSNSIKQVTVQDVSAAPVINSPVCPSSPVSGTSTEAEGTTILVYKNGSTQIGTGSVHSGNWTAATSVSFTVNDVITATATAPGKCVSTASSPVTVTADYIFYRDADGDGYGNSSMALPSCSSTVPGGYSATGGDCNDADANEKPGQTWYIDNDGDGYGSTSVTQCSRPAKGYLASELTGLSDCDDNNNTKWRTVKAYVDNDNDTYTVGAGVFICIGTNLPAGYQASPSASDDCNDNDNTKWQSATLYTDQDGDTYTVGNGQVICYGAAVPAGYSLTKSAADDCNDNDNTKWQSATLYVDNDNDTYTIGNGTTVCYGASVPSGYAVNKSATDDCDDNNNQKWQSAVLYTDADGDTYTVGNGTLICYGASVPTGYTLTKSASDDCDDTNNQKWQSATLYVDADGDTYTVGNGQVVCYGATVPTGFSATKSSADDCNDNNASINPAATDIPDNNVDENCDGADLKTWYEDKDGDGFGNPASTKLSNTQPVGYVSNNQDCNDNQLQYQDLDGDGFGSNVKVACGVANNSDCNDNQVLYQNLDADGFGSTVKVACGGVTNSSDCNDNQVLYQDLDGDGFGSTVKVACGGVTNHADCDDTKATYADNDGDGFGAGPKVACGVASNTDCNDNDNTIYPGATDIPDGKDNDCNGKIDDGPAVTFFRDFDGDGFGDPNNYKLSSSPVAGYVTNNLDCNDYRTTYQDLDGDGVGSMVKVPCSQTLTNSDCNDNDKTVNSPRTYYRDNDGDSYGDAAQKISACSSTPPTGYVANSIDCNDNNGQLRLPISYFRDADGDGFGTPSVKTTVCSLTPPAGYVSNTSDCDDSKILYQDKDKDGWGSNVKVACGGVTNNLDCNDNNAAIGKCSAPVVLEKGAGTARAEIPVVFALHIMPNPVNKNATITYELPQEASVSVAVVDFLGRQVGNIYQGRRSAGVHTLEYNAGSLAAGVYYVKMVATTLKAEAIRTQKMVKVN